jgi:NADH-quinone oxidoreductase E subunit
MESFELEQIINKYRYDESALIGILQDIQQRENYLPQDTLRELARQMGVPLAQVFGLATFYKAFSLKPRGKHLITVCLGTACHVRGSGRVVNRLESQLGVQVGETTKDNQFTLQTVNCLGCCAMGPVIMVNQDYHTQITPRKVGSILRQYRR